MPFEWLENSFRSVSLGFCVEPSQCSVDPLLNGAAEICKTSAEASRKYYCWEKMCIFVLLTMKLFG